MKIVNTIKRWVGPNSRKIHKNVIIVESVCICKLLKLLCILDSLKKMCFLNYEKILSNYRNSRGFIKIYVHTFLTSFVKLFTINLKLIKI